MDIDLTILSDEEFAVLIREFKQYDTTGFIQDDMELAKYRDRYFDKYGGSCLICMERELFRELMRRYLQEND